MIVSLYEHCAGQQRQCDVIPRRAGASPASSSCTMFVRPGELSSEAIMRGKYLNQEERRFVCDSYLSGQGMPAIRKKMGVGGSTISRILREGGVRARTKSESMTIEMK